VSRDPTGRFCAGDPVELRPSSRRSADSDAAQHIYAIAQQVLRNAREHKEVKTVAFALRADADYLTLVMSHSADFATVSHCMNETFISSAANRIPLKTNGSAKQSYGGVRSVLPELR
jgi:hypothetical protein